MHAAEVQIPSSWEWTIIYHQQLTTFRCLCKISLIYYKLNDYTLYGVSKLRLV